MTRAPRWEQRRRSALALRLLVLAAPLLTALVAARLAAGAAPVPRGSAVLLWWAGLLVVASAAAWAAHRAARRLLPFAALLELSLPFPAAAPSRWAVARRVATPRARQEHVSTARRWRRLVAADETPEQAVHRVLPLALAVTADDRTPPGHVDRVVATADLLGRELGLPPEERDALRWAALLSPLGLLTTRGRALPADSARLAGGLLPWLGHHGSAVAGAGQRFDPAAPLGGRVLAVATAFATLTQRDDRGRLPDRDDVMAALRDRAGTTLDPALVALLTAAPAAALAYAFGPWSRTSAGLLGAVRPAGLSVPVTAAALGLTLTALGLGTAGAPGDGIRDRQARDASLLDSQAAEAMGGFIGPRPARALAFGRGSLLSGVGPGAVLRQPPDASTASAVPTADPADRLADDRLADDRAPGPDPSAPPSVPTSGPASAGDPAPGAERPAAETASPAPRPADPPPSEPAPAPEPADSTPQRSPEPTRPPAESQPTAQPSATSSPKPERSKPPKGAKEPSPTGSPTPKG